VPINGGLAREPVIAGPCQLGREESERFACGMPVLHAGQRCLPWVMVASEQRGRFGKGPREVGVADVLARGAQTRAGGFLRTPDPATIRDAVLPPWGAVEVVAFGAPHAAEDVAHPGHRWPQRAGLGIVLLGGVAALEFQATEERIVSGAQGQVDREVLWDRERGQAVGDARTVRRVGDLLAEVGSVVGRVGIWHRCSEFSAFAPQGGAAPEQVTGGAQVSGVNLGWREHPPA
jgi:hypothetical protein